MKKEDEIIWSGSEQKVTFRKRGSYTEHLITHHGFDLTWVGYVRDLDNEHKRHHSSSKTKNPLDIPVVSHRHKHH